MMYNQGATSLFFGWNLEGVGNPHLLPIDDQIVTHSVKSLGEWHKFLILVSNFKSNTFWQLWLQQPHHFHLLAHSLQGRPPESRLKCYFLSNYLWNIKYLVPKDRGFKELLLELMGPKPVESYSKYKTVQTSPNPRSSINFPDHLARAGVAMSVWTAMDMGIPPQWMFPRVSFRAMLYLGFHSSTIFHTDVNIFNIHPKCCPLT